MAYRPVALIVLDGWGIAPPGAGNAVALARTPVFDALLARWPHARLATSGRDVGLPDGQFGNSEVGHLNLGAGFVVRQDLTRIDAAIADGALGANAVLTGLMGRARARGATLHLAGLVGDGGVHAHDRHLAALLDLAAAIGPARVRVHAFTDGRDSAPDAAAGVVAALEARLAALPDASVATVAGRYYAMDRDRRWDRTARAYAAVVAGVGPTAPTASAALAAARAAGVTDEFVPPTVVVDEGGAPRGPVRDGDAVLLFNYRSDRMRQLLAALSEPGFDAFARRLPADLDLATLTAYADDQRAPVVFAPIDVARPLARVVADAGLTQFHTAETEKFAHVTWFINGGREAPFPGEARRLVPSRHVATYDLAPEMRAAEVTDGLVARLAEAHDGLVVVNYANADMVGHTGVLEAAVRAVEAVDASLGRALDALAAAGGVAVVTADHGNAECMIDPATGGPHTAHTTNPVPIVVVGAPEVTALADGRLADVAPTVLDLMGLEAPAAMTGHSLVTRAAPTAARTTAVGEGIIARPVSPGRPTADRLADGMSA